MSHSKYSTELYNVHIVLITAGNVFVLTVRLTNTQSQTRDRVQERQSMPLPMERQEWVQGTAPSSSSKGTVRSRGEGQVFSATYPAVARPRSRRFSPPRRLFQHFALTRAFVGAAHPQIVNGSSPLPLRSRSAPFGSVAEEEGRAANKDVSC